MFSPGVRGWTELVRQCYRDTPFSPGVRGWTERTKARRLADHVISPGVRGWTVGLGLDGHSFPRRAGVDHDTIVASGVFPRCAGVDRHGLSTYWLPSFSPGVRGGRRSGSLSTERCRHIPRRTGVDQATRQS